MCCRQHHVGFELAFSWSMHVTHSVVLVKRAISIPRKSCNTYIHMPQLRRGADPLSVSLQAPWQRPCSFPCRDANRANVSQVYSVYRSGVFARGCSFLS